MEHFKKRVELLQYYGAGFNNIYPEENKELFKKILENDGCVISEYPPEIKVDLSKFPYRNRIISGLCMGTLVVEARYRSGSSATAKYAKEQGRKLFCIPSNIDSKPGYGPNKLIQEGAKLVISPQDILEEFNIYTKDEKIMQEIMVEKEYLEIYNAINYMPININIIAKKCNLTISSITPKLLMMEIKGYIKRLPANEYVRL